MGKYAFRLKEFCTNGRVGNIISGPPPFGYRIRKKNNPCFFFEAANVTRALNEDSVLSHCSRELAAAEEGGSEERN